MREGFNRLSFFYRPRRAAADSFSHTAQDYRRWLAPLFERLPDGARVLDLGCGTGAPAVRLLAERFDVTGVDMSDVMIRRARGTVPAARFLRADMTEVRFPAECFDAVLSLYAIIHVPLGEQRPLLARIHSWLKPQGLFVAILGHGAWEGTERNWLGVDVPMFWSHAGAATYRGWIREAGFVVQRQQFIPEGDSGHELFLARKSSQSRARATRGSTTQASFDVEGGTARR